MENGATSFSGDNHVTIVFLFLLVAVINIRLCHLVWSWLEQCTAPNGIAVGNGWMAAETALSINQPRYHETTKLWLKEGVNKRVPL